MVFHFVMYGFFHLNRGSCGNTHSTMAHVAIDELEQSRVKREHDEIIRGFSQSGNKNVYRATRYHQIYPPVEDILVGSKCVANKNEFFRFLKFTAPLPSNTFDFHPVGDILADMLHC